MLMVGHRDTFATRVASNVNSKAGTTLALSVSQTCPVNSFVLVFIATDNLQTTDGEATQISGVTDSAGNTYSRLWEYAIGRGAAKGGAEHAVFAAPVTTELSSGGTITVTNTTSAYARCASAFLIDTLHKFASATLTVASHAAAYGTGGAPASISLTGLAPRGYLWLLGGAFEITGGAGSFNSVPGFNLWGSSGYEGTTGGGSAGNMSLYEGQWGLRNNASTPPQPRGSTGVTIDLSTINAPSCDQVWTLGAIYLEGSLRLHRASRVLTRDASLLRRL